MSAFAGLRVIELAERVAGEYCGKLLADFGAEVIKVERPGTGSPTRAMAPIVGDPAAGDAIERSGLFAYLNTNKKSVVLDLGAAGDAALLHRMIAAADAVIDDHDEAWAARLDLAQAHVLARHPHVVFCAITPFGQGAPADLAVAKSASVFNASGWGFHTPTEPDYALPPLKGAGRFIADYEGGLEGAMCTAAALFAKLGGGGGEYIDISQTDALASRADILLGRMIANETPAEPDRAAYDQAGPATSYACADGYVYLYMTSTAHWSGLKALMGQPGWATAMPDDWLEYHVTPARVAEMRGHVAAWLADKPKQAVSDDAQQLGVPLVPVNDAADLHRSPQFAHRGFFKPLTHPVLGEALYPTVPYTMSASPAMLRAPAPRLGADDALRGDAA